MHRKWQRLRRNDRQELQRLLSRVHWGSATGRAPVDSARKLAARAEARVTDGRRGLTIVADYAKYCETIELAKGRAKFIGRGALPQ